MKILKRLLIVPFLLLALVAQARPAKPVVLESKLGFSQTVEALEEAFKSKGMTLFARIDHQAAAQAQGLDMQPATVIVYGAPKVGTPLMRKDPSLALQLPMKVLVTEVDGKVKVMLNSAKQVVARSKTRYAEVENTLGKAEQLIRAVVTGQ